MSQVSSILDPTAEDILLMLACGVHMGSKNIDFNMRRYIHKRRKDGVHIINLQKTWQKLLLAARVIATIENPADVCLISAKQKGQRSCLKFAEYVGASTISGRFTPGTFTNQSQNKFLEPRLLVVCDPREDHQPLTEASYVNIPTIAFCNSDSSVRGIDIAIPCNNESAHSIGLMYWLLAREVLRLKGTIPRGQPWMTTVKGSADDPNQKDITREVIPDAFFYKSQEELDQKKAEEELKAPHTHDESVTVRPHTATAQTDTATEWTSEQQHSWAEADTTAAAPQTSQWTTETDTQPAAEHTWGAENILSSWDNPPAPTPGA